MSIININTHDVKCRDCALCIGRHIGEKDERERIIKLLETQALDYVEITCDFSGHGASFDEQGFIALIKGEKND